MIDKFYQYLSTTTINDSNKDVIESLLNSIYYLNYIDPFKTYDSKLKDLMNKFKLNIPNTHIINSIKLYKQIHNVEQYYK